jgi:hypothetical protein
MAPTSSERWYFPDPPREIPREILYFEKWAAGTVQRCQILVCSFGAFVWGDDGELAKGFSGAGGESQAVKYVEELGYVQAVDWQLPPPAR